MATNWNAVKKLNQAKKEKQQALAQAYEELGGSNPAYKPIQTNNVLANPQRMTATIPQLEKAVVEAYNTRPTAPTVDTGNGLKSARQHNITRPTDTSVPVGAIMDLQRDIRNHKNLQQEYANLYNDILNNQTQRQVSNPTPIASQQTIMGMGNGAYGVVPGVNQEDAQRLFDVQSRERNENNAVNFAQNHPVLATLGSVVSRPIETTEGVVQNVGEYLTGKPLTQTYNPSTLMRNTVTEGIDSNVGRMAYGAVNSIGDMALAAYLGGGASGLGQRAAARTAAAIMGTEKAADVMNDAIERGLTPDQIVTEGVLSGASTAITEAMPFENLWNGSSIIKNVLSEGGQEVAEDLVDTLFDEIVTRVGRNNDRSSLSVSYQQYIDAGYTPDEAFDAVAKDYRNQLIADGVLGGITGGLVQGGANVIQGRNFFTGNLPSLNAETNTQSETNETIPEVNENVDNVKETNEDIKENVDTIEQLQTQQTEPQNEIPTVEKSVNAETNAENTTVPEVQNEARVPHREIANVKRTADALKAKLDIFSEKIDVDPYIAQLDEAYNNVINTSGNAQAEAVQNFNNTVDFINNEMSGQTLEQSARDFNQDGYDNMRNVTDGRRIAITPAQLESTGYKTLRELNSAVYSGKPNSTLKFYSEGASNTIPLDNVYGEMRDLSNGELPNATEGDQLPALVNWVTQYKSGKDESIEVANWDRMSTDNRNANEVRVDEISDNLFDLIEDGKMTGEDFENATRELSEIAKNNPELSDKIFNLLTEASDEYRAKRYNADVDPDIANADSYEALGDIIDAEIDSLDEIVEDATFPTSQPGVDTGRLKESQTYNNTGEKSGMTQREKEIHSEKAVRGETGGMLYTEVGEQESYEQAQKNLEEKGEREEAQRLFHKNGWNQVDTDEAMTLLKQTREEAESIEANGGDATNEWGYAADLFVKIQTEATNHAQALQALAKWSRVREDGSLTPEGRLAAGVRAATQATKVTNSETNLNAELAPKKFQKKFKFKKEFIADFLKTAREFDKQKNNLTIRQQAVGEARLAKMIRQQIPMTLRERITSILMDDMLFSIRTLISRNAGGNAGLALVDQTITKLIAGGIDRAASRFTGVRTTTGLTAGGARRYIGGLKEGTKRTAQDYFKDDVNTWKPGQENDFEALINENRRLFNDNGKNKVLNKAAKVGNFLDRIVSFGLTFGDNPFYTGAYRQSEYEFDKLREEGWFDKTKDGKPISDEQFEKIKQAHSVINALTAVYQNDTALSRGLMEIRKGLAEASKGTVGLDVLTQAAMPFVKTPANVALTAIEYSPFGIAKNAIQTFREVAADYKRSHGKEVVGDLTFNQQRFVRETSRNLVGTMLYALAIGMAQAGRLTGAYSDDDDMEQAQREAGMQEYAFVSPFTGNQWQTSWIPVIGNAAVAGAATVDAMRDAKEGENPILEGLKAGAASQFENSMLQGLSRLFGTQSSFSSDSILKNVGNTIKSAGTQLIPSIVRQVAAAMDPYQRDTRGIEPNDRYINSMIASLPVLRENLQPRIGRTGEELEQNAGRNAIQKWLDNLVNPAIVTTPNAVPDAVRDEAMRLHESLAGVDNTAANGAFEPYVTIKQITTDTHTPTLEEYTQYQREAYGQMNSVAEQMIGTDYYQNLSDLNKAKALAKIYEAVRDSVRCDTVDGSVADLDAAARIYNQEGADALIEYVITGQYLNQIGVNNSQSSREYVQQQLQSGNFEALNQDVATGQELADAGFSENLTFKYNHATQYIPSLTPTEFAETWNTLDGMIKPNGTVSQDEILAYLNQKPTSWNESDATMYWQAYLQNPTYQPYFDEESGTWKKHKP